MTVETAPAPVHRNEVRLVGRVAATARVTELPSGDAVATVRIVVERPPAGQGRRAGVDTLSCAAWTRALRRALLRWQEGDVVEVTGALRRRFWRADGGAQSRYEIELDSARRLGRPERVHQ